MNIASWLMRTIVAFQAIPLPEEPGGIAIDDFLAACAQIPDIYPLLFRGGFVISLLINDLVKNTNKVKDAMIINVEARNTIAGLINDERECNRRGHNKSDGIYGLTWLNRTLAMVARMILYLLYGDEPRPEIPVSEYRRLQSAGLHERGEMIDVFSPPRGVVREMEITEAGKLAYIDVLSRHHNYFLRKLASGAFHLAKPRATLAKEAGTTMPELKRLMKIAASTMQLYVNNASKALGDS